MARPAATAAAPATRHGRRRRRARGDRRAGQRDAGEEDPVEQDEEGQQEAPGALRAHSGLGDRPQRERGAAGPGGGEQPGGGGAAERDLRAGPQVQPRGRALADEPEERDVADEGEQLGHGPQRDPARIGGKRAAERVGEHLSGPPASTSTASAATTSARGSAARRASSRRSSPGRTGSAPLISCTEATRRVSGFRSPAGMGNAPSLRPTDTRTVARGGGCARRRLGDGWYGRRPLSGVEESTRPVVRPRLALGVPRRGETCVSGARRHVAVGKAQLGGARRTLPPEPGRQRSPGRPRRARRLPAPFRPARSL